MVKGIEKKKAPMVQDTKLQRELGLFDALMMVIGIVIGSGIFLTTGIMAEYIPSASLILLAWVVGGLLTLAGALTYGELGAMMPEAGGQYVYLREAYGDLVGFLFGWITFTVYVSGAIAALGIAFIDHISYFIPIISLHNIIYTYNFGAYTYELSVGQIFAAFVIVATSVYNYYGLNSGKIVQNIFTVIKIFIIAFFIFAGFFGGKKLGIDFSAESLNPTGLSGFNLITGFGIALISVTWAYDAWNNITFASSEIKDPARNIPLSLVYGTLIITVIYLLMNYLYLTAVPISDLAGQTKVAEIASTGLFGGSYTGLFALTIAICIFGGLNASVILCPRVYFAMAKDKLFFKSVGEVHPKYKTPGKAIILQGMWASLLALSGTFNQLIVYAMFASILFWIAAASAVFTLRRKYPNLHRKYKVWGYPYTPAIFIAASAGILLNTLYTAPIESLTGIGIMLLGLPAYWYWKRTQ